GDRALDRDGLIEATRSALEEVTLDGKASWLRTPDLPGRLRDHLAGMEVFHMLRRQAALLPGPVAAELSQVPGDLIVPVRSGPVRPGVLVIAGGLLDRDSVLTSVTLASHLALKLENYALFHELEESRRLATLGSFAAAIAHDIRTPLTSVQMNVQI